MKFKNKTVLVTGSSRGIGRAIALAFAKNGAYVILNCKKSVEELLAVKKEVEAYGNGVEYYVADVSKYEETKKMFDAILVNHSKIDILINNASISQFSLFNEMAPSDWDEIMNTNFYSVLNCSHFVVNKMIQEKSGVIINISSIWGEVGASCEAVYAASKGAVNSFTKALAKELAPSGIKINAISCGVIHTEMNSRLSADEKEALKEQIPVGRFGECSEVADLALFLADGESTFLTGQVITIDGAFL